MPRNLSRRSKGRPLSRPRFRQRPGNRVDTRKYRAAEGSSTGPAVAIYLGNVSNMNSISFHNFDEKNENDVFVMGEIMRQLKEEDPVLESKVKGDERYNIISFINVRVPYAKVVNILLGSRLGGYFKPQPQVYTEDNVVAFYH